MTEKLICIAFIITVVSMASCNVVNSSNRLEAAKTMQKAGADVLDIPCATSEGTEHYCMVRAAAKKGN